MLPRGDVVPSRPWGVLGDRPLWPIRLGWLGCKDIVMEVIPLEGEAMRLGSLHTEVGGATKAISGIGEAVGGMME